MTSSKFSRRPMVQQPPPVCKSKKVPPVIVPPPPPPHNSLRLFATWDGLDSYNNWRSAEEDVLLQPNYPDSGHVYTYVREDEAVDFLVWLEIVDTYLGGYWEWDFLPVGNAVVSLSTEIDPNLPIDTGIVIATSTMPRDQTATWRLYSAYTP